MNQLKTSDNSQKILFNFVKHFFIVFVVIVGLAGVFRYKLQSEERLAQNQAVIDNYAELLKPLPPRPSPTPTPLPKPLTITKLPPKISPPSYSPSYTEPNWAKPADTSSYSTDSEYSSDYSPSYGDKTVSVRGYTRKDGTYVRPHMRRSPRR